MVKGPPHVIQLFLNHVSKIGLNYMQETLFKGFNF
jgi:hypothetical protein